MKRDKLFIEAECKLYSYKENKIDIKNITEELKLIEIELESKYPLRGHSILYTDVKVQNSKTASSIEEWLLYQNKEYDRLLNKKIKKEKEINKIKNALELLNSNEKIIIEMRYFERKAWSDVADKVGYSKSYCKTLRVKSIDKIKNIV